MPDAGRKRLYRTSIIYWTLLLYIVAALVWWYISLNRQNDMMRDLEVAKLEATSHNSDPVSHTVEMNRILSTHQRNRAKYLGEGGLFFLLILLGAGFVYRSIRRQFDLQQQQENFMMAITHELKTPISVTNLNLETLMKYSLEPEKQKKLIRMTLQETARLNFLTNNILIAAQIEGSHYKSSRDDLDLSDLLKDCIHDFRIRYPERTFAGQVQPNADVKGDALLLQMLINNLLENAIKYSPKETVITAALEKENEAIVLRISDQGPGIPAEEKKKIFLKFYRVGNENTRKTQGTGLGLYLCRIIAKYHKADILVTNNYPSGSTFVVRFFV